MDEMPIPGLPLRGGHPVLGNVILLHRIGGGGMGQVYAGWHDGLEMPVAVKFMKSPPEKEEEFLSRFKREARLCAELDEPNLLRVHDFGSASGVHYFVMEWVPGRSLDDVISRAGPLTEPEAVTVLRDVGQALLRLHRQGVVHRDIKPGNVMLRARDGRIKLADLGLATESGSALKVTKDIVGTPIYMSPEQIDDSSSVDASSDLFSLASTVFTLLTGKPPFTAGGIWELFKKIQTQPLPDPATFGVAVSDRLRGVLAKMGEKDRAKRFRGAEELLEALPIASLPFRKEILEAAKPSSEVRRPEGVPPSDDARTITRTPELRVATPYSTARQPAAGAVDAPTWAGAGPGTTSLLFCECLQNDFLLPIRKGQAAPNKLHVGWSESARLVGEDAAKGPLVRAVSACASAENVRIVHIRDWHDPHDPAQRPEIEFFGDHCLMGTEGARFLDVIEHFSRDRRRSAVLDSVGINDFERTPMNDILEALTAGEDHATIPVGVIGVWTNVKVQYLLYDLKTRAGFQNLATCSALVASPDRAAHGQTLKHLEQVLGVNVFHRVEEFLAFLGVETVAPGTIP
jgi:serine/threonine protein kinase/nicotinamidase-related amidase